MSFTVSKENGILIFNDLGGYETRNPSTIWCIKEADKLYNWEDFKVMHIDTHDYEWNMNNYTYSKQNNYDKLIPDFNFHNWIQVGINDYTHFTKEIDNAGACHYEIHKVGWIGNTNTNAMRKTLLDIGTKNADLFAFFDMCWLPSNTQKLNSSLYISMPELVKTYSILIDIEGNGYSGRLKHLLWSHRPLLLVDRPHKEFFFEYLKEWEHYIPVKRDLSNLLDQTKWCFENYDKALEIAENAYQFSKTYLTREACYKQWNRLITKFLEKT